MDNTVTTDGGVNANAPDAQAQAQQTQAQPQTQQQAPAPVDQVKRASDVPQIPLGGGLGARPLHFVWICDHSGSMQGQKIRQLNTAIREAMPFLQKVADDNPNANVLVSVIAFSNDARWMTPEPIPIRNFQWNDLEADGSTAMGKACHIAADMLDTLAPRGLPPVLVLITDGQPMDDFHAGLGYLMSKPWGRKAVRVAVAIGEDCNMQTLQEFIGNIEKPPITVKNIDTLVKQIRLSSTVALKESAEQQVSPSSSQAYASSASPGSVMGAPTHAKAAAPAKSMPLSNTPDKWAW